MSQGRMKLMQILMRPDRSKLKGYQKQPPPKRWNIVRGDTVQVIDRRSSDYGKQGTVKEVIRSKMRVVVENVNLHPFRIKGDPERGTKGQTVMKERSMHYSNVNLVDPVTGFPTKVTYSFLEDGTKVRVSKRSGAIIPKPDLLKTMVNRSSIVSEDSDTAKDEDVWSESFVETPSKWAALREELLERIEEIKEGKDKVET
mmetsp:Transcript_15119/g.34970  ORF Transcript_15119/g.34970 Transcript_15119/m.34970 type:complete len:200 (+) Transcript_15119:242-841(+)